MKEFCITFSVRKGLGPDFVLRKIFVGIDDLEPSMTEHEIKTLAISEAERELYLAPDYKLYGKNWTVVEIENI